MKPLPVPLVPVLTELEGRGEGQQWWAWGSTEALERGRPRVLAHLETPPLLLEELSPASAPLGRELSKQFGWENRTGGS